MPSASGLSSLREIPLGLFDPKGEGTTILLYVGNDSSDNTASHCRGHECLKSEIFHLQLESVKYKSTYLTLQF